MKFNAGLLVTGGIGGAAVYWGYPDLRKEPYQMFQAIKRAARVTKTFSLMAIDYIRAEGLEDLTETHEKAAKRLFRCFTLNGGPYIKLGQMIGQLQDIMPDQYCDLFEPMCMQGPATEFKDVKSVIEEDYGCPLTDLFTEFSKQPIASASLGQVHKARLKSTGEEVAVKV
jgi:predicted unusual protein kinase regulating ubiquinone biosynthesis (AarF/ABC1/UbiB family)